MDILMSVWGSGRNDVYAVGGGGTIVHSADEVTWQRQASLTTSFLSAVWGSGATDLYAVGASGTILRSRGDGTWTRSDSGTTAYLHGVVGRNAADVFVVGEAGLVLRSTDGASWAAASSGVADTLLAAWWTGTSLFLSGNGGVVARYDGTSFALEVTGSNST